MQGWKTEIVVDVMREAYPHLRWEEIAAALDHEVFLVPDDSANKLLLSTWQRGAGGAPFPLEVLCGRLWSNTLGQLSFLKYAVGVPPHLVRWDQALRKLVRPLNTEYDQFLLACTSNFVANLQTGILAAHLSILLIWMVCREAAAPGHCLSLPSVRVTITRSSDTTIMGRNHVGSFTPACCASSCLLVIDLIQLCRRQWRGCRPAGPRRAPLTRHGCAWTCWTPWRAWQSWATMLQCRPSWRPP